MSAHHPEIPTQPEREREELERWVRVNPDQSPQLFERLLRAEFQSVEQLRDEQFGRLQRMARFAGKQVPFYREQFKALGMEAVDLKDEASLAALPVLQKSDVLDRTRAFLAAQLPPGEKPGGWSSSTGTTGRPVKVAHTLSSRGLMAIFWCRQARWFRLDPEGLMARIRFADNLPFQRDGSRLADGETQVAKAWGFVGPFFRTGPEIASTIGNPREWHVRWLREHNPDYLLTFPGIMEEIALVNECRPPAKALKGLIAVSSLMTASMRELVERVFEVPVHQNYGLNEIGIVAVRCAAGRYHVHAEANLVEIVDEAGKPVAPGERGRLLVSSLANPAMPLFRYDTGDMAVAAVGPCPCGRTLPSFADIAGRYRRFAYLPEGSRERYHAIAHTIQKMPAERLMNLRQFQVHQYRDWRFELRLRTAGALSPGFYDEVREAWLGVAGEKEADLLKIVPVEEIADAPGGKLMEFTSDFYPEVDGNETLAGRDLAEDAGEPLL